MELITESVLRICLPLHPDVSNPSNDMAPAREGFAGLEIAVEERANGQAYGLRTRGRHPWYKGQRFVV